MWDLLDSYPPAAIVAGAVLVALVALEVVHRILRRLGRRVPVLLVLTRQAHRPAQLLVALSTISLAVRSTTADAPWRDPFLHAVTLAIIVSVAWLVGALLVVAEEAALSRYRTDVPDNRQARRIHTQIVMLRRVTGVVIAVLAFGVMLMTFPSARTAGASLLASAGVAGVIAGFAAQSMLSNVIAGLQLAFSDALRLDDVVVVEGEWGRIEELTLSYVVLRIWDDRRLILPTSYFTAKPFEQWTRTEAHVLGTVEVDIDWLADIEAMRAELHRILRGTDLWDGRSASLQVTGATGPAVRVRALVSAIDGGTLWELRCLVREQLVTWVRERAEFLPKYRAELDGSPAA